MSLNAYKKKRKFAETPEPSSSHKKEDKTLHFVVQKHHASRLHYDFRLELDGVLKSWAVPKGPSLNPADKRLAVMVEDHPYDYRDFEGIIPPGNYGAGTVMVWDEGTYHVPQTEKFADSQKKLREGLIKGHLEFILEGKKLRGQFSLVRMGKDEKNWLLIKHRDEFSNSEEEILDQDTSVKTGRTMNEIREGLKKKSLKNDPPVLVSLKKLPKEKMPTIVHPMLGVLVDKPFDREGWLFEIKWDGYRALAFVKKSEVDLYSRNQKSFNELFHTLLKELKELKVEAILDGEVVILDPSGKPQFQLIQNYQKTGKGQLVYYVFDILHLNGHNLRQLPLTERKEILKTLLAKTERHQVHYSDHIENRGTALFKEASRKQLEGIMAKNGQSTYQMKRSSDWLKIKTHLEQEVVIGGFTQPRRSRKKFGALLIGVFENNKLNYVGHVGGGFSAKLLDEVFAKMTPLIQKTCPFENPPKPNMPVTWIKPQLVCEVSFAEWTKEGIMRQPIFQGLRIDKKAREVVKESETPTEKVVKKTHADSELTHPDKVLWKEEGYTKKDLIDYYDTVSPYILPYLKNRPLVLHRFPNGIDEEGFYQKNMEHELPSWIKTIKIQHENKVVNYLMVQNKKTLLYVANLGSIDMNPFHSKFDNLDRPDYFVIDLDPENISFESVVEVAQEIHEVLEAIGVKGYCKTSGGRGLHIVIPLHAQYSYDTIKKYAEILVAIVHKRLLKITSLERMPEKRQKKVYLDILQNGPTKTIVSAYSVRPRPHAPVSTPLEWKEVKAGLDPLEFTIRTMFKRLDKVGDLFKPILGKGINLEKSLKKLEGLM